MQIQGQLTSITDIAGAYVVISNKWIREAIHRMELLATVKDQDWDEARKDFNAWSKTAVESIHAKSRETSTSMGPNIAGRIGMLERLAIQAASDNE
jgi:hypothetical protein